MSNENNEFNENPETITKAEVEPTPVIESITLGQMIRRRREERGLSLKVISQQTKIHIGLLEYLEADQFKKLPSKTYVRGFVKSTAKILGINIDEALVLLEKAYSDNKSQMPVGVENKEIKTETARNTLSAMTEMPLEAVRSVTMSSTAVVAKFFIGLMVVGIVGFNIKNNFEKNKSDVEVNLPEVLTTLPKKKVVVQATQEKAPVVDVKKEDPIQVNLIQEKNPKAEITLKDVKLENISIGEKQFSPENLTTEQLDQYFPPKYRINPTKGVEMLFLNAVDGDAWITYKVDDKDIKKFVLRQGRTLYLKGALIRLFVGNTKSVKAFYNNKPVNLSLNAKSGVKNIVLPEELKTKYLAPLFVFLEDGTVEASDTYVSTNQQKKVVPAPVVPAKKKEAAPTPPPAVPSPEGDTAQPTETPSTNPI